MEEMPLQKKVGLETQVSDPTTRLLIGRLATFHGENCITFIPQRKPPDGTLIEEKCETVVYATWNIRGITHK
jgi:hypothetical protein